MIGSLIAGGLGLAGGFAALSSNMYEQYAGGVHGPEQGAAQAGYQREALGKGSAAAFAGAAGVALARSRRSTGPPPVSSQTIYNRASGQAMAGAHAKHMGQFGAGVFSDPMAAARAEAHAAGMAAGGTNVHARGGGFHGPAEGGPRYTRQGRSKGSGGDVMKKIATGIWGFVKRHPYITATSAGLGAGFGAGASTGFGLDRRFNANEGNIKGISSSSSGGISPELQFSTQGLVQSLHKHARRR
jgi:hypothetical protein